MLYQAYQAHTDIMVPVRAWAGSALRSIGQPLVGVTDNVVLRNLSESGFSSLEGKRVQQCNATFKGLLNSWSTRDWKAHRTQLLISKFVAVADFVSQQRGCECDKIKE